MLRAIVCGLALTAFASAARAGELDREAGAAADEEGQAGEQEGRHVAGAHGEGGEQRPEEHGAEADQGGAAPVCRVGDQRSLLCRRSAVD